MSRDRGSYSPTPTAKVSGGVRPRGPGLLFDYLIGLNVIPHNSHSCAKKEMQAFCEDF